MLTTLAVDESVFRYAEKLGIFVLATGDEVMGVKNGPGFKAKRWRWLQGIRHKDETTPF